MQHALIIAHPDAASFTHTIAEAVRRELEGRGHDVCVRDLYALDFDPRLKRSELPGRPGAGPAEDVVAERAVLSRVKNFVFVYPFWVNAPPAILKGYIDRVFGSGFAFAAGSSGATPLLEGRTLISFTSSGAPQDWALRSGVLQAEQRLFDEHFGDLSGLTVLDHIHFGGIIPGIRADVVERHRETARAAIAQYF